MANKTKIDIVIIPPNPLSKEYGVKRYSQFNLQDLDVACFFGDDVINESWVRFPEKVEPGDVFEIVLNELGKAFLVPKSSHPQLLSGPTILVSDDLYVWLIS